MIGPTADEIESKSDRSTDLDTIESLAARGGRILGLEGADEPGAGLRTLRDNGYEIVGTHSGIRVATEHRDYQIRAIPEDGWITVGGVRSTGLTASPGIGEYVGELYRRMAGDARVAPSRGEGSSRLFAALGEGRVSEGKLAGVTQCATSNGCGSGLEHPATPARVANGPVPDLADLAAEYKRRGDGKVTVWGGEWVVTHPLASFGMESYDGENATS